MRIRQINLDDNGKPERVTAELSLEEALYITSFTGTQNAETSNDILPGGASLNRELYQGFAGELFNRFWEDGEIGAKRGR